MVVVVAVAVAVGVDVEEGLAEGDAGADALRVALSVDGVHGELCSCLTKAAVAGSWGTHSLCSLCALTRELPRSFLCLCFLFGVILMTFATAPSCTSGGTNILLYVLCLIVIKDTIQNLAQIKSSFHCSAL